MSDLIENKTRQLEHDSKNLDFGTEEEEEPNSVAPPVVPTPTQSAKNTPVQKSAKRQPAHSEDKPEKQPSKNLVYLIFLSQLDDVEIFTQLQIEAFASWIWPLFYDLEVLEYPLFQVFFMFT